MEIQNSQSGDKAGSQANPLEQYLLTAKEVKGQTAVLLIMQVLEAPGVYVFSELLDCPNISELKDTNNKKYYDLLELFAYGVYEDYQKQAEHLPELSEGMRKKLRHLTLISLATGQKSLPVSQVQSQLALTSTRQLEDIIIEAIYAGIISGRLDQKNGVLEVDFAIGRDIRKNNLDKISNTLQEWCDTCDAMLANVEQLITKANASKQDYLKHKNSLDHEICNIKANLKVLVQDSDEPMMLAESRAEQDKKRTAKKALRVSSTKFWPKSS